MCIYAHARASYTRKSTTRFQRKTTTTTTTTTTTVMMIIRLHSSFKIKNNDEISKRQLMRPIACSRFLFPFFSSGRHICII